MKEEQVMFKRLAKLSLEKLQVALNSMPQEKHPKVWWVNLCEFNGNDVEYYQNSWQNYRYGLGAIIRGGKVVEYVVASMVGDEQNGWGNGTYYDIDQFDKAFDDYSARKMEYKGFVNIPA